MSLGLDIGVKPVNDSMLEYLTDPSWVLSIKTKISIKTVGCDECTKKTVITKDSVTYFRKS